MPPYLPSDLISVPIPPPDLLGVPITPPQVVGLPHSAAPLPPPPQPAEEKAQLLQNAEYQETMVESTFMYLTLDLPTAPLYKDEKEQLIIPQVPLFSILAKFNGATEKEYKTYKENFLKRFQLTRLPPYLIFCIKRFTKNNFFVEKNPTIVNFPITWVLRRPGRRLWALGGLGASLWLGADGAALQQRGPA